MGRFDKKGTIGLVKRCVKRTTGEVFAVKIVKTRDDELQQSIKMQYRHLKRLSHKNITHI